VAQFPSTSSAYGIWSLNEVRNAVRGNNWPLLGINIIQTFTSSAEWVCPEGVSQVEYLVVAGGGGSGGNIGGGGGAGGFRTGTGYSVTAGTTYTVTVGAGGATGVNEQTGTVGSNSVFGNSPAEITSAGGGGGSNSGTGGDGGSGVVILKYKAPPTSSNSIIFNESGTWLAPTGVTEIEYLVVAGGGGGGYDAGGGGGAGGFRAGTGFSVSPGTSYKLMTETRLHSRLVPQLQSPLLAVAVVVPVLLHRAPLVETVVPVAVAVEVPPQVAGTCLLQHRRKAMTVAPAWTHSQAAAAELAKLAVLAILMAGKVVTEQQQPSAVRR